MKAGFIIIVLFFIFGCSKQQTSELRDVDINIMISDKEGKSLLDPTHNNFIDVSKVKIYYLINNEKIYQYDSNLNCPTMLCSKFEDGNRWVQLFPNTTSDEELPITYIEWSENHTDTIKCQFFRTENSVVITKVWFSDELVYPNENKSDRVFQIVK